MFAALLESLADGKAKAFVQKCIIGIEFTADKYNQYIDMQTLYGQSAVLDYQPVQPDDWLPLLKYETCAKRINELDRLIDAGVADASDMAEYNGLCQRAIDAYYSDLVKLAKPKTPYDKNDLYSLALSYALV